MWLLYKHCQTWFLRHKHYQTRSYFVASTSLHLHLSLNCKGCWGTIDDFTTSFFHRVKSVCTKANLHGKEKEKENVMHRQRVIHQTSSPTFSQARKKPLPYKQCKTCRPPGCCQTNKSLGCHTNTTKHHILCLLSYRHQTGCFLVCATLTLLSTVLVGCCYTNVTRDQRLTWPR